MKNFTITVCSLLVLVLWGATGASGTMQERYTYMESNGAKQEFFAWELLLSEGATVVSENEAERSVNNCRLDGATTRWEMKKAEMDVVAVRQENTIVFKGSKQGRAVERNIAIDGLPWYQPLSFSLRNFLRSQKNSVEFWMVRPDQLELVKMRATRQFLETIAVNNREEKAVRIEVRLTGLLSGLWSCQYWFREEDGVFLKYEGVHGPPGTPKTVIQLLGRQKG